MGFRESKVWYAYVFIWAVVHVTPFAWWAYMQYLCWLHIMEMASSNVPTFELYSKSHMAMFILLICQWFELLHAVTKAVIGCFKALDLVVCKLKDPELVFTVINLLIKSLTLVLCVLYSWRFLNKSSIIEAEDYSNKYLQIGYVGVLFGWSLEETVKYPYYFFKLFGANFALTEWISYNTFWISYPVAIAGEMRCWFGFIQFLNANIADVNVNFPIGPLTLRDVAVVGFALTPLAGIYMFYAKIVARRNYMTAPSAKNTKRD
eukprot:218571_1